MGPPVRRKGEGRAVIPINVSSNLDQALGGIDAALSRQILSATTDAINKTARNVMYEEIEDIKSKFDRPTPFTLRSMYIKPAVARDPVATVWLKDDFGLSEHYLNPNIFSGPRRLKRFESKLRRVGVLPHGMFIVPGEACPLDAFGNIQRGMIQQVLSYLSAAEDVAGFSQNTTGKTRKGLERRIGRRVFNAPGISGQLVVYRGDQFTTSRVRLGKDGKNVSFYSRLPQPGIWVRAVFARGGDSIRPLFIFVRQPTYRARWDFFGTARKTIDERFPTHFAAAWQQAVATAR